MQSPAPRAQHTRPLFNLRSQHYEPLQMNLSRSRPLRCRRRAVQSKIVAPDASFAFAMPVPTCLPYDATTDPPAALPDSDSFTRSTFSSVFSLPTSDVTSDDRDTSTSTILSSSRRRSSKAIRFSSNPCLPPLPPRPSSIRAKHSRDLAPTKKRAASEAHRARRSSNCEESLVASADCADDSSVWFAETSSSPLLRCNKVFADRFPVVSHPIPSPTSSAPTLHQLAAEAASIAEPNEPTRRSSRPRSSPAESKPTKDNPSLSNVCKSSSTGAIAAPFPSVLSSFSALSSDGLSSDALSSDSSLEPPPSSGVVFSPRHTPDREADCETWSNSRRHLAIPRGKLESVQRSLPTRLPRTRVFIQRSRSGHNAMKQDALNGPNMSARTVSVDPTLQTCRRVGDRVSALAESTEPICVYEEEVDRSPQKRASYRSKSVSAQSCPDPSEQHDAPHSFQEEMDVDTDVEMLDVGTSRMLSVGSYEIRRQHRSAVMAFRQAADNRDVLLESSASLLQLRPYIRSHPFCGSPLPSEYNTDDDFSARVRAHASLTALDGSPRRVDEPRSMEGMNMLGRRRGMRMSGRVFSGSQRIRPEFAGDDERRGARRKLKKVARRLFRFGSGRDARKEPVSDDALFDVQTKAEKMSPSSSGDADIETSNPRQASDMYMEFMKDTAEREVRSSQLACLPKVMARAHIRVKPRRGAPQPVLNVQKMAELAS